MDWTFFVLVAGLSTMIAALAFGNVYVLPGLRRARQGSADEERFKGFREICAAAVAGGQALLCIAFIEIVKHGRFAENPIFPVFFFGGGTILVWQCGFHIGRASLRWRQPTNDSTPPRAEAWEN